MYRAVFRACYNRFRDCALSMEHIGAVALEFCAGPDGARSYGRKGEEYSADFCLVSRRHLDPDDYQLFKYHFLLGASAKLCCRRLKLERGIFFHRIYRIEEQLGRVFATLEPYPLYPVSEYFAGVISRNHFRDLQDDMETDEVEEPVAA